MRTIVGICSESRASEELGLTNEPTPTIWFQSWRQAAGVLSDENRALLHLIRDKQPRTVMELAGLSGRAASNLSRTLKTLEHHGLVRLHRSEKTRALRPEALATEFIVLLD